MNDIEINKAKVLKRIRLACKSVGRKPADVQLVWVSKTKPVSDVEAAIAAGATHFGENRVQEALEKFLPARKGISCHVIGPLQGNKMRKAVSVAQSIDTIVDVESVLKLDYLCLELWKQVDIMFQVNTSEEISKSGIAMADAADFLRALPVPQCLTYRGLMTIGKNTGNPEDSRKGFAFLRGLRDKFNRSCSKFGYFTELSMGMSDDLEVAVAEGSTQVRIGSALFGKRLVHNDSNLGGLIA